ncbi:hypothetical protein PsorP6_001816 [Peronosclerospora sorghi]|uniref:Uncharacterized protein n=1 Tax=Peronosclerospora sorghi TaxID=230839 RepID=A0ACC0WVJ6_9STRA|nr:hypothetical protein PsorP6_001816 [Peronosclerospora sorghi]
MVERQMVNAVAWAERREKHARDGMISEKQLEDIEKQLRGEVDDHKEKDRPRVSNTRAAGIAAIEA